MAKRLNRTLVEKARCMLITSKLDNSLCGAAVTAANYLRNLSPCAALDGKSRYKMIYNKKPKISHLRVFSYVAFTFKLYNKDDKCSSFAKKDCILIGYGEKEGIYWILDKNTNKAFRSRDVQFNEHIENSAIETEFEISRNEDQNFLKKSKMKEIYKKI